MASFLLLSFASGSVQAQAPGAEAKGGAAAPNDEVRSNAKAHFLRGLAFAKDNQWQAALAEFSASFRIFPTRAALSNVALSLSKVGRNVEALASYDQVLQAFGQTMNADELSALRASREELVARVGELVVESEPSGATVSFDGRILGTTPLAPVAVDVGSHTLEISKQGHVATTESLTIAAGQRLRVRTVLHTDVGGIAAPPRRATLQRDAGVLPSGPGFASHAYVDLLGGLAWAPSFGGGADAACSETVRDPTDPAAAPLAGCAERSNPFGFLAGARGGYALTSRLGVEVFLGYFSMRERLVRRLAPAPNSDPVLLFAPRYEDTTLIRGPATAVSVSYALARTFPLIVRVWVGMTLVKISTTNFGAYSGVVTNGAEDFAFVRQASIAERDQSALVPFVGPELQIGYPVSSQFQIGFSMMGHVLFAPTTKRTGSARPSREGRRSTGLPRLEPGVDAVPREIPLTVLDLPEEDALGTALVLVPSLWLRTAF